MRACAHAYIQCSVRRLETSHAWIWDVSRRLMHGCTDLRRLETSQDVSGRLKTSRDVSRRLNLFFFVVKNEKSSHVSQTPYLVTMLFSRPRWSFFQGVPNIWGIPFKTFSGLFGELKTFWGNLGPHVLLITLWRQVKIVLCTDFYEEFDRKKISNFFYTEFECKIFLSFFSHWI